MSGRARSRITALALTVRRRLADESGIALPIAVTMLAITLSLTLAATQVAVSSNDGASRDSSVKRALQAADAGIEAAVWRTNTFMHETTSLVSPETCPVHLSDGTVDFTAPGSMSGQAWCPATSEDLGNGESYSYAMSGYTDFDGQASTLDRRIVSTGTVDGVTRRVVAELSADDPRWMLSEYAVISDENLILKNSTTIGGGPEVIGSARSNGSISLSNSASISGNATPGPGGTVTLQNNSSVGGSTAPAPEGVQLPPPRMRDGRPNDNGNICVAVSCSGVSHSWNPTTRALSVSNGRLVLVGNVFAFCSLNMSNSGEIEFRPTDPDAPIRVYLGSLPAEDPQYPEADNCSSTSFALDNTPRIYNTSQEHPILQVYMGGPGSVDLRNNNADGVPMALYAPEATVTLENHGRIDGGVIAKQVSLENNTTVVPASGTGALVSIDAAPFDRGAYHECTSSPPETGLTPDAGC